MINNNSTALPLISVIVPIYKVEAYLEKCIKSIVAQSYTNLEIILVDDGSPDNCPEICDDWANRDSRIKVIHKPNGGLSDARNAGLKIASGELIGFVDADDYISDDMYELLYDHMLKHKSDISACGVEMFYEDGSPSKSLTPAGVVELNTHNALLCIINESLIKQPVYYKLYKRELIKDLYFPVGKYHEDVFWSYKAISSAKTISAFDKPCYFYRQRNESIMGAQYSLKRLDALEAKAERAAYIQNNFPALAADANADFWFSCIYTFQMSLSYLPNDEYKKAKNIILTQKKTIDTKGIFGLLSPKQKAWFFMSRISFTLTCKIRNFLKIGF